MDFLQYENRYTALRTRWDKDMKLSLLEQYVMKDSKGVENKAAFASITPNLPKTYMDRSVAFMGTAKRRWDIRGPESKVQKVLEEQRKAMYGINDELLAEQGQEPLQFCLDYFACIRGWVAGISLMQQDTVDKDLYVPDIRVIDPRWLLWEYDSRGMKWGAWRNRYQPSYIKDLWGFKNLPDKEDIDVYLKWDRNKFEVWIADYEGSGNIKRFTQGDHKGYDHKMGICPIICEPVPNRPSIIGGIGNQVATDLQWQGESLYAWNRELYEKLAELVSVWATLNKMQVLSPIIYIGTRKFNSMPFGLAAVLKLEKGEEILSLPTKDMSATAERLFGQLVAWIQQGSLPTVEFGDVPDRTSGVLAGKLSDTRNVIFVPRFNVESTFLKKVNRNIRYQLVNDKCYQRKDLKDLKDFKMPIEMKDKIAWASDYFESVVYTAISPEENIANMTLAKTAKELNLFSKETILREQMKTEDPAGELAKHDSEEAEDLCPELKLMRRSEALWPSGLTPDEIKTEEAKTINWRLKKIFAGELPPIQPDGGGQASMPNLMTAKMPGSGAGPTSPGAEKAMKDRVQNAGVKPEAS